MKFSLAILTLVVAVTAIPKEPSTEAMQALAEKLEREAMAKIVEEPDCGISSATVFKRDFVLGLGLPSAMVVMSPRSILLFSRKMQERNLPVDVNS
ncbi:hypothetical protein BZA77DRAFT_355248 [Pyronema omphalodes]|nr:hypothetical protein BZA77DRAFT_355248 [Pyronema omphalodes]